MRFIFTLFFMVFSSSIFANNVVRVGGDNVGLEIKNSALVKLLDSTIDSYFTKNDTATAPLQIPDGAIEQVIKKDFLLQNAVIKRLQQFLIIDLSKDLEYTVKWSPISIEANIANKEIFVVGHDNSNLQVAIKVELDRFSMWGRSLEIIEKSVRFKNREAYGGLYGKFENFEVSLNNNNKVQAVAIFNINIGSNKTQVKLENVYSNLVKPGSEKERIFFERYNFKSPPRFWVNFQNFYMPPPVLRINGETFEIDPQKIEDVILEEKSFLAQKLIAMTGDFFANDLASVLNTNVLSKLSDIPSSLKLIDYYNPYATCEETEKSDLMNELQELMRSMIYETRFQLDIDRIQTSKNEDIQLSLDTQISLNEKVVNISPYIHNRKVVLGQLDFSRALHTFSKHEDYDLAVGISEPMINALLNAGSGHNIYQSIIDQFMPMPGVKVTGINMHFVNLKHGSSSQAAIDVVAQVEVHFKELDYKAKTQYSKNWFYNTYLWSENQIKDTVSWSQNQIASLLESGKVYFPLQMRFYPELITKNSHYLVQLKAISPLNYTGIKNHYGYPYKEMYSVVESAIIERIKSELVPQLNNIPEIDITQYLSLAGINLKPVDLSIKDSGHIILRAKIDEIDLKNLSLMGNL